MNRFFGFFKQKVHQAKEQNKKDLKTFVKAISDEGSYNSDVALTHLQKIKANYMTWSIIIANQASTGLYYSQIHNRNVCIKKINTQKGIKAQTQKFKIILEQMKKTHQQMQEIVQLGDKWVHTASDGIQEIRKRSQQNKSSLLLSEIKKIENIDNENSENKNKIQKGQKKQQRMRISKLQKQQQQKGERRVMSEEQNQIN